MNINTNLSSLITQSSLKTSTLKLNQAIERMTTGCKINHAKDNAANYSISTNLSTKIGAYQVAEDNAMMGLDMVNTASSALETMSGLTSRLRTLAMQAKNGTYGGQSISAINAEAASIITELYRIKDTTEYNGINLLSGKGRGSVSSSPSAGASLTLPDGTELKPNSKGFLKNVSERNTASMTKLSSVSDNTVISSGTYSISTAEELAKLATMTNDCKIRGGEFVLANDIDLSAYSTGEGWIPIGGNVTNKDDEFAGTFDGNGHVVSNLHINRPTESHQGLFGDAFNGTIKNLGVVNANVTGLDFTGALAGTCENVENCYSTGTVQGAAIGGLIGLLYYQADSCYSKCSVTGRGSGSIAGGLLQGITNGGSISNSFAIGNVKAEQACGLIVEALGTSYTNCCASGNVIGDSLGAGLFGFFMGEAVNCAYSGNVSGDTAVGFASMAVGAIKNCNVTGKISGASSSAVFATVNGELRDDGSFDEYDLLIENCGYNDTLNPNMAIAANQDTATKLIIKNITKLGSSGDTDDATSSATCILQIGINSNESNQILFSLGLDLDNLNQLVGGVDFDGALDVIDEILSNINSRQTEFGAVQNRLESVLEEVSIQYENLVSSRSTLQDADIAKVSSEYIRQQILQQASATLMATANQTPAIALQLL